MQKWVIPCNPKYYDVIGAFKANETICWKQSADVHAGDIIYIYVGKPVSAILYETKAEKVNLSELTIDDNEFVIDGSNFENNGRYMELRLLRSFDQNQLPFSRLKEFGLKSVQGPSRITSELDEFIVHTTSLIKPQNKRQYFFVFQNESFDEEYKGGYLWAPQYGNSGRRVSHWEQMKNVRKGDLIIHSYIKKIVAVSIAKTDVYEADRPSELPNQWETEGWKVDTEYYLINNPIVTSDHMDVLMKLQPAIDAPFNRIGRGNTGYLFKASKEMAEYILKESVSIQGTEAERKILLDLMEKKENDPVENQLDKELNEDVDAILSVYSTEREETYYPEPKKKPEAQLRSEKKVYPRDRKTSINALIRANHKCEVDENHPSFIRKNNTLNYTEPHHLIPMAYQDSFENSIDVEANIVALCSNCHNQIHYGKEAELLLVNLFDKRKEELLKAGLPISQIELLDLY